MLYEEEDVCNERAAQRTAAHRANATSPQRRATWRMWRYSTRRHMLEPVRPEAVVLTDLPSLVECILLLI